jgi:hypothetical protein
VIIKLEVQNGETLPLGFAKYILGSGPSYERKYKEAVPPITVLLIKGGKTYKVEGGFWMEIL